MILSLHIKNIALIQEVNLELSEGLNILSGETGAGKSIIIDSLNFVLGERADRGLIRHGEKTASVRVVFSGEESNPQLDMLFLECGIEKDDIIIVHRAMTEGGKSECRVNGTLINLSNLKRIVTLLVDVHSQHEHQSLLVESNHIKILDTYAKGLEEIKEKYQKHLEIYQNAKKEIDSFPPLDMRERQLDILKFQIDEIERVAVKEGEEEELIKERAKINNYQKIALALGSSLNNLDNEEGGGAVFSVYTASKDLLSILEYDNEFESLADRLESVKIELADIADTLKGYSENTDFDTYALEKTEKRIDEIRKAKKRFGNTVQEIEDFYHSVKKEYERLLNAEERIIELNTIIDREGIKLVSYLKTMHEVREKTAKVFEKAIVKNLYELGMVNSTFKVEIDFPDSDKKILASATAENGADNIRFLISPNKGEPLKPLAKIASGGEMSRFMLGLKNITAELEGINTLIFDEIDTGISGNIAKVVAGKLYDIARNRQVIAVTHLPQLASMADNHYLIDKREVGDKTLTFVNKLTLEKSLIEIMRLAGSAENSEVGLENAKELKRWANDYKNGKNHTYHYE